MVQLLRQSPGRTPWKNEPLKLPARRRGFGGGIPTPNLVAHFDETTIIGDVTGWTNKVGGAPEFNLSVVAGTAANLKILSSGMGHIPGPGVQSHFISSDAGGAFLGDIDARWWGRFRNLPTGPDSYTCWARDSEGVGQRGTALFLQSDGTLFFAASLTGATFDVLAFSTLPIPLVPGDFIGVRVHRDATTGVITFYTSPNKGAWTQLGNTVGGAPGALFANPGIPITIGAQNVSDVLNVLFGEVEQLQVSPLWGEPELVNFNSQDASSPQADWTDPVTGATWGARGDAFVNTSSFPVVLSSGGVGLKPAAPQTIAQPTTVFLVVKGTQAIPLEQNHLFDADGAGNRSYNRIAQTAGTFLAFAGSQVPIDDSASTAPHILTSVFNGASGSFEVSGFPKVNANIGANAWDFATLFGNNPVTATAVAWIGELAVYQGVSTPDQVELVQTFLENKWL